jgi:hypothetical protein
LLFVVLLSLIKPSAVKVFYLFASANSGDSLTASVSSWPSATIAFDLNST